MEPYDYDRQIYGMPIYKWMPILEKVLQLLPTNDLMPTAESIHQLRYLEDKYGINVDKIRSESERYPDGKVELQNTSVLLTLLFSIQNNIDDINGEPRTYPYAKTY